MAFNSSTNKVATKRIVKVVETRTTAKFTIEDDRVIDRVLDGRGKCSIVNEEKIGESLQFDGTVYFSLLFLTGSNQFDSETLVIDFQEKTQVADAESVAILPEIKSYKFSKEGDKVISVVLDIETKIYGTTQDDIKAVVGEEDGYYAQSKILEIDKLVCTTNSSFVLNEDFDLPDAVAKVIYLDGRASLTKAISNDNFVTLVGNVVVDMVYLAQDNIKKIQKVIEFNQEVSCLNATSETVLDVMMSEKRVDVNTSINESGDRTACSLEVVLGVCLWGYSKMEINVITDVFSDKKTLNISATSFENTKSLGMRFYSDRQNITIDMEDKKRIDEVIVLANPKVKVERATIDNSNAIVEGSLLIPVIFKNYDSEDVYSTILQTPYKLTWLVDELLNAPMVNVEIVARCNSYKNKAGKDLSLTIDFDGMFSIYETSIESYISKIEEIGECPNNNYSIVIYKPEEKEGVFEIAKKLCISPDVLMAQNPQIEDGKEISKVVIYKRNN